MAAYIALGLCPGVSHALLEKYIHVTDALMAIMAVAHECADFVFCCGTGLVNVAPQKTLKNLFNFRSAQLIGR